MSTTNIFEPAVSIIPHGYPFHYNRNVINSRSTWKNN